ncbi:hypothetical protein H9L39_08785 [Fusarium oxysporum f. sp. albedinis]|nr:hypothetical protein H9L39_08785 [Fusarium oxysporum f. sp. albedinis]
MFLPLFHLLSHYAIVCCIIRLFIVTTNISTYSSVSQQHLRATRQRNHQRPISLSLAPLNNKEKESKAAFPSQSSRPIHSALACDKNP